MRTTSGWTVCVIASVHGYDTWSIGLVVTSKCLTDLLDGEELEGFPMVQVSPSPDTSISSSGLSPQMLSLASSSRIYSY